MRRIAQWAGLVGVAAAGLAAVSGNAAAADAAGGLGAVTGVHQDGATFTLDAGKARVRVVFLRDDVFRLWVAPDGDFTDPAKSPPSKPGDPAANIVVKKDYPQPRTWLRQDGSSYRIGTGKISVEVRKDPALFSVRRADGSLVWAETKPLSWDGKSTTQTLAEGPDEQFVGGGEQNGSFSHRGKTVQVGVDYNWDEGGHPNSVPYYASTSGMASCATRSRPVPMRSRIRWRRRTRRTGSTRSTSSRLRRTT